MHVYSVYCDLITTLVGAGLDCLIPTFVYMWLLLANLVYMSTSAFQRRLALQVSNNQWRKWKANVDKLDSHSLDRAVTLNFHITRLSE